MVSALRRIRIPSIPMWMRRRLGFSLMVLCAAIIINFAIPRLMPGDITYIFTSSEMSPQVAAKIKADFGLDQSLWTQFWLYIKGIFTFNWGMSFYYRSSTVASLIATALPRSLILLIPAHFINIAIGYLLGVTAGWKAGSKRDSFITGSSLVLWAMPMFWVAMLFLYIGGYILGWFPISGYKTIGVTYGLFGTILDRIRYLILPVAALVAKFGASELVMRNTMTITLKQNYITTARAKGLSENRVKHRHAARNALIPLVTTSVMRFATSVAGMIFIEKVFTYPGMGKLIFDAVVHQDYPVLQASFLIFSVVVIAMIFVLDLIYARLDPRVRYD